MAGAAGGLGAAIGAQALLWSPLVVFWGLRGTVLLPRSDRAVVVGVSALVGASAVLRAVPPEANWWAPAALVMVTGMAVAADGIARRARAVLLATVLLPTALAVAHTMRPFLPLAPAADPTARLHGWSRGAGAADAAGVGTYGVAAERCVYQATCDEMNKHFRMMDPHERGRPSEP
jgi:hypothetical protein